MCWQNKLCWLKTQSPQPGMGSGVQCTWNRYTTTPTYYIVENSYLSCNKTSLPSLSAVQGHLVMLYTKPGRSQQNRCFVSNVLTCGIPFQTVRQELHLFPKALFHWQIDDVQAFSIFLQFRHLIFLIQSLWVYRILLQREIIQHK